MEHLNFIKLDLLMQKCGFFVGYANFESSCYANQGIGVFKGIWPIRGLCDRCVCASVFRNFLVEIERKWEMKQLNSGY